MTESAPRSLAALGASVRGARKERGLSLDALAALTGISKPYLSNIETARASSPPSEEKLRVLEGALGFTEGYLVEAAAWIRTPASVRAMFATRNAGVPPAVVRRPDGTVDLDAMMKGARGGASSANTTSPVAETRSLGAPIEMNANSAEMTRVPLINRVAAGRAAEHTNLDYPAGVAENYLPLPEDMVRVAKEQAGEQSGALFATRVLGESMMPEYREGEMVVVCDSPARDGDDCLVRLDETENFAQTLKRVYFVSVAAFSPGPWAGEEPYPAQGPGLNGIRLVPLNPEFKERVVPLEHVTAIYPVMWKVTAVARGEDRLKPELRTLTFDRALGEAISG